MIKQLLSQLDNTSGAIMALLIFATVFAGFTYWTLKQENKKRYEEAGALPLSDGEAHE
jgi:cbb3-type cytochrome oxidase subunit 3